MDYRIDCAGIDTHRKLHRILAQTLSFPDWYGSNLDALYDCLTCISTETRLILTNWDPTAPYARGFRRVLNDAQEDNPLFQVVFQ